MQDFRKLRIWKKGHELTLRVYSATGSFPVRERYGLCSQMRRAAASLGMNIAEGCGRSGSAELRRFLRIAIGSASELEYQLLLARDLKFLPETEFVRLTEQTKDFLRMTIALIRKLKTEN